VTKSWTSGLGTGPAPPPPVLVEVLPLLVLVELPPLLVEVPVLVELPPLLVELPPAPPLPVEVLHWPAGHAQCCWEPTTQSNDTDDEQLAKAELRTRMRTEPDRTAPLLVDVDDVNGTECRMHHRAFEMTTTQPPACRAR
jgi:hypothetical protein